MNRKKVMKKVDEVRAAVARAADGLDAREYDAFLEELTADAEGWDMELKERRTARGEDG